MPALQNPRHERFARLWLKHGNASKAYREAGYEARGNSAEVSAHHLLRHPKVKGRIGQIRKHMAYRTQVTVESLLQDAAAARDLARDEKQPAAMIQAATFMAKLVGLLVDRKEQGQPGDFASLDSADAIVDKVRAELGDNAAAALEALLQATSPVSTAALDITPAAPDDSLN